MFKIFTTLFFCFFIIGCSSNDDYEDQIKLFVNDYNHYISNATINKINDYFSPDVDGIYKFYNYDDEDDKKCPKEGCVVNMDIISITQMIHNFEKKKIKQEVIRDESKILFQINKFDAIVTTKVVEKELINNSQILITSNYTEKLFIKIMNNHPIVARIEIDMRSRTKKTINTNEGILRKREASPK